MRILLLGEYSNVHWTLAEGLRTLGHEVTVLSNGDFWKNYPRDINLTRKPTKLGGIAYMAKLLTILPRLRNYDIVQLINPMFLELKAERIFPVYNYLRRHNRKVVLCAFGMDYYWVNTCITAMPLRYSDFNVGKELRTNKDATDYRNGWIGTAKERLNRYIAEDCDAIVTGLYEYDVCYRPSFPNKTTFIPFPIKMPASAESRSTEICQDKPGDRRSHKCSGEKRKNSPIRLFIGINTERNAYKGTDIMLAAAEDVARKYPGKIDIVKAYSVPFEQYSEMMKSSDIILDQLYSYTPGMNALLAMSNGIVVVGGGEPENYEIIDENELRPIINVTPNYESVYSELERIALHAEEIAELKCQGVEYIRKHHDYVKVARKYEALYLTLGEPAHS